MSHGLSQRNRNSVLNTQSLPDWLLFEKFSLLVAATVENSFSSIFMCFFSCRMSRNNAQNLTLNGLFARFFYPKYLNKAHNSGWHKKVVNTVVTWTWTGRCFSNMSCAHVPVFRREFFLPPVSLVRLESCLANLILWRVAPTAASLAFGAVCSDLQ